MHYYNLFVHFYFVKTVHSYFIILMEEDKMSKQIVPLNVDYSSKKEGKSNMILMKLRKGKMEWVFYDSLDKEQLKLILDAYHLKIIL